MRRQALIGASIGVAIVVGIGLLMWANQRGLFGPYGKAKRLLGLAKQAVAHEQLQDAQIHLEELVGTFPQSPWTDDALILLGQVYESQQQYVEARAMFKLLLERFPSSELVGETQQYLGNVNVALLFSPIATDLDAIYEVQPGDTLTEIASAYNTTVEFIRRANGLKGDLIYPQQKLKVPNENFSIVVDKSQNQLLLTEGDEFVKTYRVATGTDNSTPAGTFKIVSKEVDPVWYRQGAVVSPDSPENILGTRWMGMDAKGYGIHGTVNPDTIGQSVTAGCIRMTNSDVEELYSLIPLGTEVTIVD